MYVVFYTYMDSPIRYCQHFNDEGTAEAFADFIYNSDKEIETVVIEKTTCNCKTCQELGALDHE